MTRMLGAIALAILLPAAATAQTNLVLDGSFDDPTLSSWRTAINDDSTIEWSSLDVDDAPPSGSARVAEDGSSGPANSVFLLQSIPVVPGDVYSLSASYRIPSTTVSGLPRMRVEWQEIYSEQSPHALCAGEDFGGDNFSLLLPVPDTWRSAEFPGLEAPAGAFCMEIYVGAVFAEEGETTVVYWDDVRVVPEPGATAAALAALIAAAAARRTSTQPARSR